MSQKPPQEPVSGPQRQVVAVGGNRCVVWAGSGMLERLGSDLSGAVGKPRLVMVVQEEGVAGQLVTQVQRLLSSSGFCVRDVVVPRGLAALDIDCAQTLAKDLCAFELSGDDALVAVGGQETLSLVSWLGRQWCGGVSVAALPTTLEALVGCPGTPCGLGVAGVAELLQSEPGISFMLADPKILELRGASEGVLRARALMVQTAFIESSSAFETLVARSLAMVEGSDDMIVLAQALETARARGRIISSHQAAVRKALSYGSVAFEALAASVGPGVPTSTLMAEGLRLSARLAWQVCGLEPDVVFAQDALLERLGLGVLTFEGNPAQLLAAFKAALTRRTNRRFIALPEAIGRTRPRTVEDDVLLAHLEAFCASRRPAAS